MKKNKTLLIIITVVAVVLIGGAFLMQRAQQKVGEKMAEGVAERMMGGAVDIEEGGEKVTIKGKDGEEFIIGGGDLPDNLPSDIPIYPGSSVETSFVGAGEGIILGLATGDNVEKVTAYYKKELEKNGWIIDATINTDEGVVFTVTKEPRGGAISVGIDKETGETVISITVGEGDGEDEGM